ncbi:MULTISPECIES: IS110 family transposase [unclassified Sphingomonas]|uniref:IS110 family transposase n=1 Tax=unclassified Sphingomonas TaxID=196159 RepID=UPI0006FD0ABF|nr:MULTISPECIES: IS110 family transposase [unclassified Sphingomonas]KRB78765.1 hypothetical protein ASE00_21280 [Sphingomonas sp. Root710]KRB93675.1 hypothetical protein ASE22_25050 [Sphingomonas sp. Root720]
MAGRTRLINQLRAVLLERAIILTKRRSCLAKRLDELMEDGALAIRLLRDLRNEWASLDRRIGSYDDELAALTRDDEQARRLATIPGIGVINATALLAAVGDASAFAKGRDLAAWLGLTPRQHSTGGRTKLLGISKRGNKYLRTQLIHGARAALVHFSKKLTPVGAWVRQMLTRAHPNVVVVALAAQLAGTAWAVLRNGQNYEDGAAWPEEVSGRPSASPLTMSVEVRTDGVTVEPAPRQPGEKCGARQRDLYEARSARNPS